MKADNDDQAGGAADRSFGESTSTAPPGPACATCTRYQLELGECRARPPAVFMLAQNAANLAGKVGVQVNFPAAWPRTAPHDWCGEYARTLAAVAYDNAGNVVWKGAEHA